MLEDFLISLLGTHICFLLGFAFIALLPGIIGTISQYFYGDKDDRT